jgi:A/G-specific adenine glycosylase
MMDLGAGICTPKRPACVLCPVNDVCIAHARGEEERFPVKAEKAARPTRRGDAFVAIRPDGAVLLRTRTDDGLLGGMSEVPGSDWSATPAPSTPPLAADWQRIPGVVVHVFTHFRLELNVYCARLATLEDAPAACWWSPPHALPGEALPSVMRKVIEAALPGATARRPTRRKVA